MNKKPEGTSTIALPSPPFFGDRKQTNEKNKQTRRKNQPLIALFVSFSFLIFSFFLLLVALLVPEYVLRLQERVRNESRLHRPETRIPHRKEHSRNRHDVPWGFQSKIGGRRSSGGGVKNETLTAVWCCPEGLVSHIKHRHDHLCYLSCVIVPLRVRDGCRQQMSTPPPSPIGCRWDRPQKGCVGSTKLLEAHGNTVNKDAIIKRVTPPPCPGGGAFLEKDLWVQ